MASLKPLSVNEGAPDERRRNSFDIIRLVAALAVAFGHQTDFAGYPEPSLGPLGISLSNMALFVFFALSGYLIWQSLDRDPSPRRFALARIRRIYPGAITNAIACVILGAAATTLSQQDYWTVPETWSYLVHGLAIVVAPTHFTLPGVFGTALWPDVNTPIWTLKYELLCYLSAFLLHRGAAGRFGARPTLGLVTTLLAGGLAWHFARVPLPPATTFYADYNGFNLLRFGAVFAFGALLSASEGQGGEAWHLVARTGPIALATLAVDPALYRVGLIMSLALLAVEVGRSPLLFSCSYRRFGDLSYGIYLYACPVGQLTMQSLGQRLPFWAETAVAFTFTILFARVSWSVIERPALALRFRGRSNQAAGD